ncbi:MAG: flavodoxin family protein [Candidatus Hodarchaeota archaeon]
MKVLVVYDSVSPMKLTAKVAKTIGEVLKEKEIQVDSLHIKNIEKADEANYYCLIVGAPTMFFKASSGIIEYLRSLSSKDFSGKLAAAFDTQLQGRFSGNAAKGIEKELKKMDFKIISPPLITYVEGKQNQMNLKEGELEKAKAWAQTIAEALSK